VGIFTRQKRLLTFVTVLLCIGLFSSEARSQTRNASLEDIVVTNTRDSLLVYFTVTNCFTEEMVQAIENGISTSFLFFIRLYEKKDFWWDEEIASVTITHEIKYDNLRRVYVVKSPFANGDVIQLTNFEEAKKLMSEIVGFKLVDLSSLGKGKRYKVSMMAQLDKVELPFYLHHILFFVKLWDFKTPWYNVEFIY
jgi:hypothetical protein